MVPWCWCLCLCLCLCWCWRGFGWFFRLNLSRRHILQILGEDFGKSRQSQSGVDHGGLFGHLEGLVQITKVLFDGAGAADAFVLSALLPREIATVFAAFGPDGYGACPVSSVSGVLAAEATGIPVTWWAGGVPPTPLAARLHGRTAAIVRAATAGLVAYLVPGSKGTALAVRLARSRGLPVFFIQ
ncbi:hypothetical protein CCP4SC76_390013 [Gammaproteobacteria bacterium]